MDNRQQASRDGNSEDERSIRLFQRVIRSLPINVALGWVALNYFNTLFGQIGFWIDTAKFHAIGVVLGSPHSPGYPLYICALKVASLIPWGTNRVRSDAVSALAMLAALTVLSRILCHLRINPWIIAGIILTAAFAPLVWTYAVVAEVYSPFLLILILYFHAVLRWIEHPNRNSFLLICFSFGLGIAHHPLIVMALPGTLWLVRKHQETILPTTLRDGCLLGLAIPTLLYLAMGLRARNGMAYTETDFHDFSAWLGLIAGQAFHHSIGTTPLTEILNHRIPLFVSHLSEGWTWLGLFVGIAGCGCLIDRHFDFGIVVVSTGLCTLLFSLTYNVADAEVFMLPIFPVLAIGAAVISDGMFQRWERVNSLNTNASHTKNNPSHIVKKSTLPLVLISSCWAIVGLSRLWLYEPLYVYHPRGSLDYTADAIAEMLPNNALFASAISQERDYLLDALYGGKETNPKHVDIIWDRTLDEDLIRYIQHGTPLHTKGGIIKPGRPVYAYMKRMLFEHHGCLLEPIPLPPPIPTIASVLATLESKHPILVWAAELTGEKADRQSIQSVLYEIIPNFPKTVPNHVTAVSGIAWIGKGQSIVQTLTGDGGLQLRIEENPRRELNQPALPNTIPVPIASGIQLGMDESNVWFQLDRHDLPHGPGVLHVIVLDAFTGKPYRVICGNPSDNFAVMPPVLNRIHGYPPSHP